MNLQASKLISRVILSDHTVRIKLLGDSITHGVGGTGFAQDGGLIAEGFHRNSNGYCWAKQFKEHMESQYNCTVENNACTGTAIEFVLKHFDTLVNDQDDIVLCTIGTNNRHQYYSDGPIHTKQEHMKLFYQNILALHDKFLARGKDVIFIANIPASSKDEMDGQDYTRIFHMCDVNDLYRKASFERGFPFISLYSLFYEYCEVKGIALDSLLQDGLHPNDRGYDVIFQLLMNELGLGRKIDCMR